MSAPQVLTLENRGPGRRQAARVARLLARGKVVALPTDTVYGLCCRAAAEEAQRRIYELKGRDPSKRLPYLIPDAGDVHVFVNRLTRAARKLMNAFWPGPLTLVLGDRPGTAVRLPDHSFVREVLRRAGGPVCATSANPSGAAPAVTGREVLEAFPGPGVDLVVTQQAPCPGSESSVVRIRGDGGWRLLREAAVSRRELEEVLRITVLLVCSGNTCRSPMGMAVLRALLARHLGVTPGSLEAHGLRVLSAGVSATPGALMTPEAVRALEDADLPVPAHASRPLTPDLLRQADLVLAMTPAHRRSITEMLPGPSAPPVLLLDPSGGAVPDPIGGNPELYRDCLRALRAHLEARLPEILALGEGAASTEPGG